MKVEKFNLTPSISGNTLVLDDDTLQVKAVTMTFTKVGSTVIHGNGHDDSNKRGGQYTLDDTIKDSNRSSSYSLYAKKNNGGSPAVALAGKVGGAGFSNVGEIEFTFDTVDGTWVVDGLAFGD